MKYIFRVKLLMTTFLLGLTAVFVFHGSMDLPGKDAIETPSDKSFRTVMIVPVESETINAPEMGGGSNCGGQTCDEARAEAKRKGKKFSHPNCD